MAEEAKFTPGPWEIVAHPNGDTPYSVATRAAIDEAASWGEGAYSAAHSTCYLNSLANARLIAAAPDLYALLAEANELYSSRGLLANDMTCGNWINNVRAALSRVSPNDPELKERKG